MSEEGRHLLELIDENKLYGLLFMRRRATNMRGTPLRAAISWMLLEEVRSSTEDFFNRPDQPPARPFQQALQRLFGKYFAF